MIQELAISLDIMWFNAYKCHSREKNDLFMVQNSWTHACVPMVLWIDGIVIIVPESTIKLSGKYSILASIIKSIIHNYAICEHYRSHMVSLVFFEIHVPMQACAHLLRLSYDKFFPGVFFTGWIYAIQST